MAGQVRGPGNGPLPYPFKQTGEVAMELNKEILDCMKTLRRRLREEQAVDIRLSQPDAIGAMLDGSLKSDDEETRRLASRDILPGRRQAGLGEQGRDGKGW